MQRQAYLVAQAHMLCAWREKAHSRGGEKNERRDVVHHKDLSNEYVRRTTTGNHAAKQDCVSCNKGGPVPACLPVSFPHERYDIKGPRK